MKLKNIFEKKGDGAKNSHFGNKWESEKKLPRPLLSHLKKCDFYKKKYWNFVIFDLKTNRIL